MPKKKVTLPKEINDLVKEVKNKGSTKKTTKKKAVKKVSKPRSTSVKKVESKIVWDVPKDAEIEYFDANLSYELTGYRPINATLGLDFDPDWFTEARDTYNRTGHYTEYLRGTKAFADYWREQYRRCKYGMTVNGYTVTGDHYFFLNFYLLKDLENVSEAGGGRMDIFPHFLEGQYEWFHYLKMAKVLKMNALMMKARSFGYSELEASIMANSYNCIKGSVNVAAAFADVQLSKLLDKVWNCLDFLNNCTDGGFFKSRLVIDSNMLKRASLYKMLNGQRTEIGWKSQIQGLVCDASRKMRGDRTDLLVFEECGMWKGLTKTYTQSDALVGLVGRQFGVRLLGGKITGTFI